MRRGDRIVLVALVALSLAVALCAVRVARHARAFSAEIATRKIATLTPATRERMQRIDSELLLSWYASPRAELPADYRHVEEGLLELFANLKAAAAGKLDYQIVDPTRDEKLAAHAATLSIAPFRARRVERDGYTEQSIWSSLRIAYGARPPATIPALGPELLPSLQALIVAHLDQLEHPRRARVAIAAPESYIALRRALRTSADFEECAFESTAQLPADADCLFWIEPQHASPEQLAALHAFLARGKSVVIAGSRYQPAFTREGSEAAVRFDRTPYPAEALLGEFGLRPVEGLVLDARSERAPDESASAPPGSGAPRLEATHLVRSIGSNHDFRSLSGSPNGSLLFSAPTSFEFDTARLADLGLRASVLATSSERTWIEPWNSAPIALARLQPGEHTQFAPRQALCALLSPSDPWHGSLIVCSSASVFGDEYFKHEAFAHQAFVRILLETLASNERLAFQSAAVGLPPTLAEPSRGERWTWRALVVFGPSLALLCFGFAHRRSRGARRGGAPRRQRWLTPAALARLAGAVLAIVALVLVLPTRAGVDLSRGGLNRLASETEAVLARTCARTGVTRIDFVFSSDERLPPQMRPLVRDARALVDEFVARQPLSLVVRTLRTQDDAASAAEVERLGVPTLRVTSDVDETTVVRRIHATIALTSGDRRELLSFPDEKSFEDVEFRLAFALQRLATGRAVHVAFASDTPHLSAAEALSDYQKKGLFAPSEGNVYSAARAALVARDFEVAFVDPEAPRIADDTDVVVWLQPRRDVKPMLAATARHLARGGKALIAAQHFVVRSRQKRAKELELTLWPEPQLCDLEDLYFPKLGIDLAHEVLFDELQGSADVDTKIERTSERNERERQRAASPLLVRAVAANFDPRSPFTRGLSDQLFLFGNRVRTDPALLARTGLRATPFIWSSERTWAYAWQGGDLPREVLAGPPLGVYLGRQPLAVAFEGRFPPPSIEPELASAADERAGADAAGKLVLIGCSEMFKNDRLTLAGYGHERLLVQSVAQLALDPELSAIAAHHAPAAGFDFVVPRERIVWRVVVLGLAPALLVLAGIALAAWRRRARPWISGEARSDTRRAALRGA